MFLRRPALILLVSGFPILAAPSVPGIDNFTQVNPHVFRGAQPTEKGIQSLARLGVHTVIDLRESDSRSQEERRAVVAAGMNYVNIPMTGLTPPTSEEIDKILTLLEDDNSGGVFVHCKRGADRTGAVIASYRIEHDHWDNVRALREAKERGMSPFQLPRQNYIRSFHPRANTPVSSGAVQETALN